MKIVKESIVEGVADKYAESEFHIPDYEKEYEKKYSAKQLKESDKDKIVHYFSKSTFIIKNPTSLKNISDKARAVISKNGDLYVLNINVVVHSVMIEELVKEHEIEDQEHWWFQVPKNLLTIQRLEGKNEFVIGESNEPMTPSIGKTRREKFNMVKTVDEARPFYQAFIDIAQRKHPQYIFHNMTYDELRANELKAKYVNEKFTEVSDPIKDLDIGKNAIESFLREKIIEFVKEVSPTLNPYEKRGFDTSVDILIKHKFNFKQSMDEILSLYRQYYYTASPIQGYEYNKKINQIVDGIIMILDFLENFKKEYIK